MTTLTTIRIHLRPEAKAAFLAAAKARGVSLSVLVVLATWREVRGEGKGDQKP